MTPAETRDQANAYANTTAGPASATSIRDRKCASCGRTIPAGERHVYDGDRQRWHAECYQRSR